MLLHVLSWFYSVKQHRDATVELLACNRGATSSYRDITVNNLGNTGVYRHEPWLHRATPYVYGKPSAL